MIFNPTLQQLYSYISLKTNLKFSNTGALLAYSGKYTGRKPDWKHIVIDEQTQHIWWGDVNHPITEETFSKARNIARTYIFNQLNDSFCIDVYLNWRPNYQHKIRLYTKNVYPCFIF